MAEGLQIGQLPQKESYTLGVTGGSATSTYALSLGYMSQEGIVGGSDVVSVVMFIAFVVASIYILDKKLNLE